MNAERERQELSCLSLRMKYTRDTRNPFSTSVTSSMLCLRICVVAMNAHPSILGKKLKLSDNAVKCLLEPFHSLIPVDPVARADSALAATAASDAGTRAAHAAVEIHAIDTNAWIVLDAEIYMFADPKAKVAGIGEVALTELIFLHLEASLENFLSFGATDGDMYGNLFIAADTESTDGETGLALTEKQYRQRKRIRSGDANHSIL